MVSSIINLISEIYYLYEKEKYLFTSEVNNKTASIAV